MEIDPGEWSWGGFFSHIVLVMIAILVAVSMPDCSGPNMVEQQTINHVQSLQSAYPGCPFVPQRRSDWRSDEPRYDYFIATRRVPRACADWERNQILKGMRDGRGTAEIQ